MFYWTAYQLFRLTSTFFFPFKIYGRKNVPSSGVFILASNHLSNLDPVLVGISVTCKISYMAKDTLFSNPIMGLLLKWGNAFPIRRDTSDVRAIRTALKRLKSGSPLLLFPEGTRGGYQDNKVESGVGFLVAKSKVPVIPVKVIGSDKVLPPKAKWFRRHSMSVVFGLPLQFDPKEDYSRISRNIMKTIDALTVPPAV